MPAQQYPVEFLQICDFVMVSLEGKLSFENKELVAIWGIDRRATPNVFNALNALYQEKGIREQETYPAARDVYYRDYWLRVVGDRAPVMTQFLFDTAVNMGVNAALKIADYPTIEHMAFARFRRYAIIAENPAKRDFLPGWIMRTIRVLNFLKVFAL